MACVPGNDVYVIFFQMELGASFIAGIALDYGDAQYIAENMIGVAPVWLDPPPGGIDRSGYVNAGDAGGEYSRGVSISIEKHIIKEP